MRVLVTGASGAIGLEEPAGGGRYDRRCPPERSE